MKYNAEWLHQYARGLIVSAYVVMVLCTLAGGYVGHTMGSEETENLWLILGFVGGFVVGGMVTFMWQVVAHMVLCFAQIEKNTRGAAPADDDLPRLKKLYQLS
jgi:hypothetical protein